MSSEILHARRQKSFDTPVRTPIRGAADGTVTNETRPQTKEFGGGLCVLELPSREAAIQWTARIAKACRCSQELREFQYDPESRCSVSSGCSPRFSMQS